MASHDCSSDRYLNKWLGGGGPGRIQGHADMAHGPAYEDTTTRYSDVYLERKISGDATAEPGRHGVAWSEDEREDLVQEFDYRRWSINYIARKHARKPSAIASRLADMGYLRYESSNRYLVVKGSRAGQVINLTEEAIASVQAKKDPIVNFNHLVTLLQEHYTTVEVQFQETSKSYTYKITKDMAADLLAGHKLVVDAPRGLHVVTVIKVHDEPQIDPDQPYAFKWAVQRVDTAPYEEQVKREAEAVELLKKAKRKQAQMEALNALLGDVNREELLALINPKKGN